MKRRDFFQNLIAGVLSLFIPSFLKPKETFAAVEAPIVKELFDENLSKASEELKWKEGMNFWIDAFENNKFRKYRHPYDDMMDQMMRDICEEEDRKILAHLNRYIHPTPAYYVEPDYSPMPFGFTIE